ncbi:tetratricopeptide repeat protein [candidate division WOR-3 bacterium]|nr:tetratricopeptide repeat protein [candidate division WOR-3 bacterium]
MRGSTPQFLEKKILAGSKSGSFEGSVVSSDIVGFTGLTESLSRHGKKGVRIITFLLDYFYETVFRNTKKFGGQVVSLSGDSYTSVFPGRDSLKNAVRAGSEIKNKIERAKFLTPEGESSVLLRTSATEGSLSWFAFGEKGKEFCVFTGDAVFLSLSAQESTPPGELSVSFDGGGIYETDLEYRIKESIGKRTYLLEDRLKKTIKPVFLRENDFAKSREGRPSSEFRQAGCVFLKIKRVIKENEMSLLSEDIIRMSCDFGGNLNDVEATKDGIVYFILFGAPLSRGSDLRRACEFMLEARERYQGRSFSSCVFGKIFTGYFSAGAKDRYAVNGEAVNLSSRILKTAKKGECLFDAVTTAGLRDKFTFEFFQKRRFKGIRDKVEIQNLLKKEKGGKKLGSEMRKDFISKISGIARETKDRTIILVSGENGMGKSSVLEGLSASVKGKYPVINFKGGEFKKDAFQPFKDFFSETFMVPAGLRPDTGKEMFEVKYAQIVKGFLSRGKKSEKYFELNEELKSLEPFIGCMCGIMKYRSFLEKIDPKKRQEHILLSVIGFLSFFAAEKKCLFLFDDADKFDFATLELIRKMLDYESFKRTVFVFTASGEFSVLGKFHGIKPFHFKLDKLSREKTIFAAETVFGRRIDRKLQKFICRKTLGNPMLIEELCRFMKISGLTVFKKGKLTFSGDEAAISGSMFSVIAGRIDRTVAEYRRILNACAVMGEEFEKEDLLTMINSGSKLVTEKALDYFEKEKLIEISGNKIKFRHSLIRDTVIEMLAQTNFWSEHRCAAAALEKNYGEEGRKQREIAFHYEMAEEYQKAFGRWQKAAIHCRESYDSEEAVFSAEKALYCLEKSPEKNENRVVALMCDIAEDLFNTNSLKQAEFYLTSSLVRYERAGLKDIPLLVGIYMKLGKLSKMKGNFEEAISHFQTAFKLWPRRIQESRKYQVFEEIGDVYSNSENFKKSLRFRKRYLYLIKKSRSGKKDEFEALNSIGSTLINLGEPREAIFYLKKAVQLVKEESAVEDHRFASVLNNLGVAYYYLGEYERSAHYNFKSLEVFMKIYGPKNKEVAFLMNNVGGLLNKMGKYEEARKNLIRASDIYRKVGLGLSPDAIRVYVNLGYNHFSKKNYRRAAECYRRVLKLTKTGAERENTDSAISYSFLGKIEFIKKNYDKALEFFKVSLMIFKKTCGVRSFYAAYVYGSIAQIYLEKSEMKKALKFFERSYILFKENLGEDNGDTLYAAVSLASALEKSGQIAAARKIIEQLKDKKTSDNELRKKIIELTRQY